MTESRLAGARWRKSSANGEGGCVEVAYADGVIGVRDTNANGAGPILTFTEREWAAFISAVRNGAFEIDELSR